MTVITKISVGKKNKNRYNIYIDQGKGEEYGFSVSEDVLIKMNLKKGMEIDQLDVIEIALQEDIQKGFSQSLNFLAHRMRSEYEIKQYLREKEYEDHVIKEVVHKLYHLKYLNDKEFAKALVSTRINAGDKGPVIILQELRQKGISDEYAEAAILAYTDQLQIKHATKLIEKLVKNTKNYSAVELKRKIEQTLARKGFNSYIIEESFDQIDISQNEDQEWESLIMHGEKAHRRYSKYIGFEYTQKMKSALYRKGFSIDLIERYLQEFQQGIGE
ncbi:MULTISPECIES: recombination regulator RecX [Bacillus]|uniref:recombination regulator RecX n=1 Tax=Bacillus TaxID=1386 RepID=UPI0002F47A31|nr:MULTISPECIES: recombination regulator RecX [Bacillus]